MRQGFEGFLTCYCQDLTQISSRSLKLLFEKIAEDSPRAAEPLLLLSLCQGRAPYVLKQAAGTAYEAEYKNFVSSFDKNGKSLESFLSSESAPLRYQKVYSSYLSSSEKLFRDRAVLEKLVPQLNALLIEKGISRYQMAKNLGYNKGNLYSFLKGNVDKMSRESAMKIYHYLST
jgi:hypothetical protein